MRICGCGDVLIAHRLAEDAYDGFAEIAALIHEHDVRFCNLETTIHRNEGYPSLFPGGGYAMAHPDVLEDLKRFGFNAFSLANNHAMDYSHKGLEATIRYLENAGCAFSGAGMNLSAAAAPAYIECRKGRAALIAVTSSFHDSDAAGMQSVDMPGRPGVNPLRHSEVYEVKPDLYKMLIAMAEETGINDTIAWGMKNGYLIQSDCFQLRNLKFKSGPDNKKIATPLEKDLKRVIKSIKEAKTRSDCVIVSIHSHQFKKVDEVADDFVVEFCHQCIENGADIIFGHGSHIMRGIEGYQNGVVFYGLADFVLQHELCSHLPADFYEKYEIDYDNYGMPGIAMELRSHNQTRGLCVEPKAWHSIMASIEFDNGLKSIKLYPVNLHYELSRSQRGWPTLGNDMPGILEEISGLSKSYGTLIDIKNKVGIVRL